jgi:hypothetical protein
MISNDSPVVSRPFSFVMMPASFAGEEPELR